VRSRQSWKLTPKQRKEALTLYRESKLMVKTIAHMYGISDTYLCRIAKAEGLCRHSKASHSQRSHLTYIPVTLPHSSLWLGLGIPQKSEK
jgi:hypothetical protein